MAKLVFIHTVPALVGIFNGFSAQLLPNVRVDHILDEALLEQVQQVELNASQPSRSSGPLRRIQEHLTAAEAAGADAILVTCSTLSPWVARLEPPKRAAVIRIDEAMIENAVTTYVRIGVLATNPSTLEPTRQAFVVEADRHNRSIDIQLQLVEGAFKALLSGDERVHDQMVLEAIRTMSAGVEVVVLAQASMARVIEVLPEAHSSVPVLTSPQTALERVRQLLEGRPA